MIVINRAPRIQRVRVVWNAVQYRRMTKDRSMSTVQHEPTVVSFGKDVLDRMVIAVERVRERLLRAARALDSAGIPYAVIGGNAVAAWVSKFDPAAVRNTADVDILIDRRD